MPRGVVVVLIALLLAIPGAAAAQEGVHDWETGANRSYLIPALEIPAFIGLLNAGNRLVSSEKGTYDTDLHSIGKNLGTVPDFDKDPFSINQIGHPYQGSIYYGLARSTGLNYWESLAASLYGSFLWETAGETTRPSINDHVASGIGGSFLGEALFRMASLLLEGGGEEPGIWRELGATFLSPPLGVNRFLFGDRFKSVFPSRDPAIFFRFRLGATLTADIDTGGLRSKPKRGEGNIEYYMTYGLPGKPGYQYKRPFDFFLFEFTAVPNAETAANVFENVTVRGLLAGAKYELGENYRGLWGLFGGYEYLSPQVFRLSTTNLAVGTVGQWWLSRTVALQGTVLGGAGFGASGTVGDKAERDYRWGVVPHVILAARLIFNDVAMLEVQDRNYWVVGTGPAASGGTERFGSEVINRANAALTVRVWGPHALSVSYLNSIRDVELLGRDRHQSVNTITLSYNFLGTRKFGAVDWRGAEPGR